MKYIFIYLFHICKKAKSKDEPNVSECQCL